VRSARPSNARIKQELRWQSRLPTAQEASLGRLWAAGSGSGRGRRLGWASGAERSPLEDPSRTSDLSANGRKTAAIYGKFDLTRTCGPLNRVASPKTSAKLDERPQNQSRLAAEEGEQAMYGTKVAALGLRARFGVALFATVLSVAADGGRGDRGCHGRYGYGLTR
jgi:hypothetical protein